MSVKSTPETSLPPEDNPYLHQPQPEPLDQFTVNLDVTTNGMREAIANLITNGMTRNQAINFLLSLDATTLRTTLRTAIKR